MEVFASTRDGDLTLLGSCTSMVIEVLDEEDEEDEVDGLTNGAGEEVEDTSGAGEVARDRGGRNFFALDMLLLLLLLLLLLFVVAVIKTVIFA